MIRTHAPDLGNWLLVTDPDYRAYLKRLRACFKDWRVSLKADPRQSTDFFFHNDVSLVLLGHSAQAPCLDLLNFFKSVKPSIPVIVLAESGDEELVLSLFRNGAWDYFKKPLAMNELKRSAGLALTAKRQVDQGPKREGIFKAVRTIQEKFATRLRLAEIARESAMSLSSFERTFKNEMGTTYSKFLNKFRVSKAASMLEQKTLSISEVAFACGFNNPYHFSRMFRRLMQISPRDYRKSFRG